MTRIDTDLTPCSKYASHTAYTFQHRELKLERWSWTDAKNTPDPNPNPSQSPMSNIISTPPLPISTSRISPLLNALHSSPRLE